MIKIYISFLLLFLSGILFAQQNLTDQSYFYGRKYFVLRSGRAKIIVQSDKANIGPAFTYLLYDAQNSAQIDRKEKAFNYVSQEGFSSSALKVIMKNYPFTALGNNTEAQWITYEGIPSVQGTWWAGGIKVNEIITPIFEKELFRRRVILSSVDLVASENIHLQLSLPTPAQLVKDDIMITQHKRSLIALFTREDNPFQTIHSREHLEIGPITLDPGEQKTIDTYLYLDLHATNEDESYRNALALRNSRPQQMEASVQVWTNSNTIRTDDTLIMNLFDACRFALPGFVSADGQTAAGVFEYGAQWVRDASNTVRGVVSIGQFELARAMLSYMLKNMITEEGTTMISGGFDKPDMEQFDQMGEFMHAMKYYVDWTGDVSLLEENKKKILTMISRPLHSTFLDSTGMVHNRREFWERHFEDAYELAYQTWVIQGLRDAIDLAKYMNATDKVAEWRTIADRMQNAMLNHPTMKLVHEGHLIKRRNITGKIADTLINKNGIPGVAGSPAVVEQVIRLMPDATLALPIFLRIIDPNSQLAKNTLLELEKLWNRRWTFGGYDRYNTSSQGDQPGPWTFATTFIMQAQHAAGTFDKSRNSLNWLYTQEGGSTGAWHEEIPIIETHRSGLLPWTSAEISYFIVHDILGFQFKGEQLFVKPALYEQTASVKAKLRYRKGWIDLTITGTGKTLQAVVNGAKIKPEKDGSIRIPGDFTSGNISVQCGRYR